jgi:Holliday junction resolvase RusA-like endonuclease
MGKPLRGTKRRPGLPEAVQTAIERAEAEDTRPRAERMSLVLPFPPSLNNLYPTVAASGGRLIRVKSTAGKTYDRAVERTVGLWVASHRQRPPAPPYALTLRVFPPVDRWRHDLTNCFKAPEDALMAAIGGDDNDVVRVAGSKEAPDHWPRIELTLEHVEGADR